MNSANVYIGMLVVRTFWMGEFFQHKSTTKLLQVVFYVIFVSIKINSFNEADKRSLFKNRLIILSWNLPLIYC